MARTAEATREAKRLQMARRRAEDPERTRAYQRAFHHRNRERQVQKMRKYAAKRFFWARAQKLRSYGAATYVDLARLWKHQRGRCAITGRKLTRENAEIDHIIPKSRGGPDGLSNIRWVCHEINFAKRDLTDQEFIALCSDAMRFIGERIATVDAL